MKFPAWAFRIINNQCLDVLRRVQTHEELYEVADNRNMRQLEDHEQVWWVLDQLSAEHRAVLALHYLQEFEVKEIAAILRKPQGTVKSRLFNGRERFREIFEAQTFQETHNERSRHENSQGLAGSH